MRATYPHILFINKQIPHVLSFKSGAEISIKSTLDTLHSLGYPVTSVGTVMDTGGFPNLYHSVSDVETACRSKKIPIVSTDGHSMIEISTGYPIIIHQHLDVVKFIRKFSVLHPDTIVLTQLNGSEEVLRETMATGIPTILFIRDPVRSEDLKCLQQIRQPVSRLRIIFNSEFTARAKRFSRIRSFVPSDIVYPPIDIDAYTPKHASDRKFITMINPTRIKGGEIFVQLAKAFPQEQFLGVEGWYHPSHDNISLSDMPNITYLSRQDDMRPVYESTKILLVPSQWQEPFGRVGVEGLAARVPVIASRCGGLTESLGHAAFFVRHYHSITAWKHIFGSVLETNHAELNKRADQGRMHIEQFRAEIQVQKVARIVNDLAVTRYGEAAS